MTIKRGVSLYSYQQTQYLKRIDLEGQIREVGQNLEGADGLEVVDEMSLRYPEPGDAFVKQWFAWMDEYGTTPVALDVGMDVLQFRDHVMSHREVADRLIHDIRLAKRLGFSNVRTLSVVPVEVIELALPFAEELDIRLGKELHQPMRLEGQQVQELLDLAERTGSKHIGIVPDFGIFQFKLSEAQLGQFGRRGAKQTSLDASVELALAVRDGNAPFERESLLRRTAGNLRVEFRMFLETGDVSDDMADVFQAVKEWTDARTTDAQAIDYSVVSEALLFSHTSPDRLRELVPFITHIHGKFNHMTEVAREPGHFEDAAIDYPAAIAALKAGGYDGYIDSEYEGQRYWQDLPTDQLQDEIEQVRRHQELLRRLIDA